MKESSAPKAINIIRPSNQNTIVKNHPPQFIAKPSKIISSSKIHEKSSTFSLYDPKQHAATVQPLKKPVIELYKPGKYQLKMLSRPQTSQRPEQVSSNHPLPPPPPALQMSIDKPIMSDQKSEDLTMLSDDEDQEEDEYEDEEEKEQQNSMDDNLPEARINRKVDILGYYHQKTLGINGMLRLLRSQI